ncbi:MAG TPA: EAL domain-containing protein [Kineosporiaceae bacterium]|nr:EAL domain-containing protein [Kineosporiaceae bacterium]
MAIRTPDRRTAVVLAVSVANLALAAGLLRGLRGEPAAVAAWHPPAWAFVVMFGVTEAVVLHIQLRRETQAISLSEIPLVLGLLYAAPLTLLWTRVVGSALVLVAYRRQPRLKLLYNLSIHAAEVCLAEWVLRRAGDPDGALTLRLVGAVYLAVAAAAVLAGWALCTVLGQMEGSLRLRRYLDEVVDYPPIAVGIATLGFVAAYALQAGPAGSWALLATLGGLLAAYRRYGLLRLRHESLERLFTFSRSLPDATLAREAPQHLLRSVRDLFHAEYAALVLSRGPSGELSVVGGRQEDGGATDDASAVAVHRQLLAAGQPLLRTRSTRGGRTRDDEALRDSVGVLLRDGQDVLGSLVVADRVGDVQTFTSDDLQLLQTVATQVSAAVRNAQLIDQLRYDAGHDALTGLANRIAWEGAVRSCLERGDWHRGRVDAVVLVDLDGFKDVNDTLGHHHGDHLLVEVARRLCVAVGERGTVARFGGDEFVVLLPATTRSGAVEVADAVTAAVQEPIALGDVQVEVQASAGIALAPVHGSDIGALLKRADLAMYSSKRTTTRVTVFHDSLEDQGPNRLALMADLRRALHDGQITIAVQPKALLPHGEVTGVEVLARWSHPQQGPVSPEVFIALAERSGLIRELTASILEQALAECSGWRRQGLAVSVAVNLSPRALLDADLLRVVTDALRRHQVPAPMLTLEITESSVIADPEAALVALHALRRLGVRLSVDDFGTGYSSLSYLKRLPVQEVKIDRSFVRDLVREPDSEVIVRAVTDLGRSLHLEVVAEGVEDLATWRRLGELGAITVQGYYLSRPMPPAAFPGWLAEHRLGSADADPAPAGPPTPLPRPRSAGNESLQAKIGPTGG